MRKVVCFLRALSLLVILPTFAFADTTADKLFDFFNEETPAKRVCLGCSTIKPSEDLLAFYRERFFEPLWTDEAGLTPMAVDFIAALREAPWHGLASEDYKLGCMEQWQTKLKTETEPDPEELAGLDALFTDSFLLFGRHIADGTVKPGRVPMIWIRYSDTTNVLNILRNLARHRDFQQAMNELVPPYPLYWALVDEAKKMRAIADKGGWDKLPKLKPRKLEPFDSDGEYIPALRKRLFKDGYLSLATLEITANATLPGNMAAWQNARGNATASNATLAANATGQDPAFDPARYDLPLVLAVRAFQRTYGLDDDGIIGTMTKWALDYTAEDRYQQCLVNLERLRWLKREYQGKNILVNIGTFSLRGFDTESTNSTDLTMRVIIGQRDKKTPVFHKELLYVDLNPYWNVPSSITYEELVPKIRKDPDYLKKHGYNIVGEDGVVDPDTIDWHSEDLDIPGHIRQNPGAGNALGHIKFLFPNRFDVYMHDTPRRYLFNRSYRALSHGCIRLQNPMAMALFLLREKPEWTQEKIQDYIDRRVKHVIRLERTAMVHIMYITAQLDEKGRVQFMNDIYYQDEPTWKMLTVNAAQKKKDTQTALAVSKDTCRN